MAQLPDHITVTIGNRVPIPRHKDLPQDHDQRERDVYEVSGEVLAQVHDILASGVTAQECRRRMERAAAEARFQGRVDAGVAAIAARMAGLRP